MAHWLPICGIAKPVHHELEENVRWQVLLEAGRNLLHLGAKPLVSQTPKCGANGFRLIPRDVLCANFSANQIPVDLESMQRCQQLGVWGDDRDRNDATIRAAGFTSVMLQHDVQDHIVVARIAVMSVLPPGTGGEMDFDIAREQSAFAEIDQRLLEIWSQPMRPAPAIDDRQRTTISGLQGRAEIRPVPPARNGYLSNLCSLHAGRIQPTARVSCQDEISPHSTRSPVVIPETPNHAIPALQVCARNDSMAL